jgi:hypothetical protein
METGGREDVGGSPQRLPRILFWALFAVVWAFSTCYVSLHSFKLLHFRWGDEIVNRAIWDIDFRCYLVPAYALAEGETGIYDFDRLQKYYARSRINRPGRGSITSPPPFYVAMIPFTRLPIYTACDVWLLSKIAALLWSAYVLMSMTLGGKAQGWAGLAWGAIIAVTMTAFSPTLADATFGQVNIHVLFLLCLSLYLLHRGKPAWAGVLLGVVFWIKLITAPIIVFYAVKGNREVALPALATVLVIFLAVAIPFGPGIFLDYFSTLLPSLEMHYYNANLSIQSRLMRIFPDSLPLVRTLYLLVLIPLAAGIIYRMSREDAGKNPVYVYLFLLTGALVASPIVWPYHHVLFLIPFVFIAKDLLGRSFESRLDWFTGLAFILVYFLIAVTSSTGQLHWRDEILLAGVPFAAQFLFFILLFLYPPGRLEAAK